MRIRALATVALSTATVAALSACGSSPQPETPAKEAPSPSPTCEAVPSGILTTIEAGAEEGTGMDVLRGAAYRSPIHEKVWFVAAEFSATGIPNQTGVWVTNTLDIAEPGHRTFAVDGTAKEFTSWGHADERVDISGADPGVEAARECLAQTS